MKFCLFLKRSYNSIQINMGFLQLLIEVTSYQQQDQRISDNWKEYSSKLFKIGNYVLGCKLQFTFKNLFLQRNQNLSKFKSQLDITNIYFILPKDSHQREVNDFILEIFESIDLICRMITTSISRQ
ncbi:unnamed protein product [Paramecium pentaurelia]|uniref:Uncharacterized protein n=1 Tax=Paramecium pentaurelia TaxID=43138 RepID=A0A8S1XF41_9CILI|nr:unnamed protein product [Paramecium pentaurelia]